MASKNEKTMPSPPMALTKETIGVWNGWCSFSDQKVAREAAIKGQHVNLAITFLSMRKNLEFDEAKKWFTLEVIKWAKEMLADKQVHRATHILNNIGMEPSRELSNIFTATCDTDLREYIGAHLKKLSKLDGSLELHWLFLKIITQHVQLISRLYNLEENSIQCLVSKGMDWKSEVATVLFLFTKDDLLIHFITAESLWRQLLKNSDQEALKIWINLRFNPHYKVSSNCRFLPLFKYFPINSQIVLSSESDDNDTNNELCNELSKFGIFHEAEAKNFEVILKRLRESNSIGDVYQILSSPTAVISPKSFTNLLINYCLENKFFTPLSSCLEHVDLLALNLDINHLNLLIEFRNLVKTFNEASFQTNFLNVIVTLLTDDLEAYFNCNPIILLALVVFAKDLNISELLTDSSNSALTINNIKINLEQLPYQLPLLKILNDKQPIVLPEIYSLLDQHCKVESSKLFPFRTSQPDQEIPNFNCAKLVNNYGYQKKINYKFYLRQSRPSEAAKIFANNQLENYKSLDNQYLNIIERKVHKFALTNYDSQELTAGCVMFLELSKINSQKLRVLLKVSQLLSTANLDRPLIIETLLNANENPELLVNYLEELVMSNLDLNDKIIGGTKFIAALKTYSVIVELCRILCLRPPELFLRHLCTRNAWLPFLIFAEIETYSVEQIKSLIPFFKSPTLSEHLTHAVLTDLKNLESQSEDVELRNSYLAKLGVRQEIEAYNESNSLNSQVSESATSTSSGSESFEIDVSNIKATLLQTLIRCHNSTDPPRALLQAAQLYRTPTLAIFATSYEPDSVVTNWLTWLGVSCEVCQSFTNFEAMAISPGAVSSLLENCVKNGFVKALIESLQIFLPDNALRFFAEFLYNCAEMNFNVHLLQTNLEEFANCLKNARKVQVLSPTDHDLTYLQNRYWLESVALKLLAVFLDSSVHSTHEQIITVAVLNKLSLKQYFSSINELPEFEKLQKILIQLRDSNNLIKFQIDIYCDNKNSRQAVINCINSLLEKNSYLPALEIAKIQSLPPDLILIKEWQCKFETRTRSQNFWLECNNVFNEFHVTADCVIEFYTECFEKIENITEKYQVIKLAYNWALDYDLCCQNELEKKMWLIFVNLNERYRNFDELEINPFVGIYKEFLKMLEDVVPNSNEPELSGDSQKQIERLIVYALNRKNLWQALKLEKMFGCKNSDLEILKLCASLAEELILPHQLNPEQRLLISNGGQTRTFGRCKTFLSPRLSSFSSVKSLSFSQKKTKLLSEQHNISHLDTGINSNNNFANEGSN